MVGARHLLVPEGLHFFTGVRTWNSHDLEVQQRVQARSQLLVESASPARGPNRRHARPESDLCLAFISPRTPHSHPRPT
eukprot:1012720-Rhodomonas_salina.2